MYNDSTSTFIVQDLIFNFHPLAPQLYFTSASATDLFEY